MKEQTNNIFSETNTIAISRDTIYKYKIVSDSRDKHPVNVRIDEYVMLQNNVPPLYSVIINEYHLKSKLPRVEIPQRFLYAIDLIDHYISSHVTE